MLGYNCSEQEATRVSPYGLMHTVEPTIPPAVKPRFAEQLNLDSPEAAAASILQRGAALRRNMLTAGETCSLPSIATPYGTPKCEAVAVCRYYVVSAWGTMSTTA